MPGTIAPLIPIAVGGYAYARRTATLRPLGRAPSVWRQACFWSGLAIVAVALVSPIDRIGEEESFWVHMSQHLLLGDIGPLLVVLGLNGALLRPLLVAPGLGRLRALAHPLVALPLWAGNLYAWHIAGAYEAALRHSSLHAAEHVLFFTTGALMWAAVVEPVPGPAWFGSGAKAVYTLVVRTLGAILASVFIWSDTVLYPWYGSVDDQRTGGLIMFTEGGIVTLLVFGVLFLSWMREMELRQQLVEAGDDPSSPRLRRARGLLRSARSPSARDRSAG